MKYLRAVIPGTHETLSRITSRWNRRRLGFARSAAAQRQSFRTALVAAITLMLWSSACGQPTTTEVKSELAGTASSQEPISCGGGIPFNEASLRSPAGIEKEESEIGRALRGAMENDDFPGRKEGYRLLDSKPDRAFVGAGDPIDSYVVLEREEGSWRATAWGECQLRRYEEGFSEGEWELDPSFPAPTSEDSVIHVLANDRQCASGVSPQDRLAPPEVRIEGDLVVVTFWAHELTGNHTCPGHAPVARTVNLKEPLGARGLADGGFFPARVVQAPKSS